MVRLIIFVSGILLSNITLAQHETLEDFKPLHNRLLRDLSKSGLYMEYVSFDLDSSEVDRKRAFSYMSESESYTRIGGIEMILARGFFVQVDHQDKIVLVAQEKKKKKKEMFFVPELEPSDLDTMYLVRTTTGKQFFFQMKHKEYKYVRITTQHNRIKNYWLKFATNNEHKALGLLIKIGDNTIKGKRERKKISDVLVVDKRNVKLRSNFSDYKLIKRKL